MNSFIIKITSPFECVIKTNNIEKFLNKKTDSLFLKVSDEKNIVFYCYPTNSVLKEQKNIPFSFNLNLENLNNNVSKQFNLTLYKNNFLSLELKPFLLPKTFTLKNKKETFTLQNEKHEANLSIGKPCVFSLSTNNFVFYKTLDFDVLEYKLTAKKDFIFVEFLSATSQILALKYNNGYEVLDDCGVNYIDYNSDKITIHTRLFDIAKHGKLIEYDLSKTYVERSFSLTYENKKPTIVNNNYLIPFAFFEALKNGNIKLARFYLDDNLSNNLTDKHLKEYFGCFLEVVPSPLSKLEERKICLIKKEENIYTTKEYTVELNENKIKNIILDE